MRLVRDSNKPSPTVSHMKVAITGASGLVGTALAAELRGKAWLVTPVSRKPVGNGTVVWDPGSERVDLSPLDGYDALIHLAGENIASRRWTEAQKRRIRDSRVLGTRLLAEALLRLSQPPGCLISASAIGFYGDRGDESLDESSSCGTGFLAEVCRDWESACHPAAQAGIRVANLRLGVVLDRRGGALAKMLTPFRLGLGGPIGSGRQYWSWVTLQDVVGAAEHALNVETLSGPVNVVSPHPVTNAEFTRTLGRVLRRPAFLPMPAMAARMVLGEMANDLLLASARVQPRRLLESGYKFRHPDLEPALKELLG
jgi:uncharacterized protein (TIGR01777 family)